MNEIVQAVQSVGFPIVVALLFWYTIDRISNAQIALLRQHAEQETLILDRILKVLEEMDKALAELLIRFKDHNPVKHV